MRFIKAVFVFIICMQFLHTDVLAQNNDTIIKGFVHDSHTRLKLSGAIYITGNDSTHFVVPTDEKGNYAVLRSQIKDGINYLVTGGGGNQTPNQRYYLKTTPLFIPADYAGAPYMVNFELEYHGYICEQAPNFYFDVNNSTLRPEAKVLGDRWIEILNENPSVTVLIRGHADASEKHRVKLSEQRAKAVMSYLLENEIDPARIQIIGTGSRVSRKIEEDVSFFKKGDVITPSFIKRLTDPEQKKEAIQMNTYAQIVVISTQYGLEKK